MIDGSVGSDILVIAGAPRDLQTCSKNIETIYQQCSNHVQTPGSSPQLPTTPC